MHGQSTTINQTLPVHPLGCPDQAACTLQSEHDCKPVDQPRAREFDLLTGWHEHTLCSVMLLLAGTRAETAMQTYSQCSFWMRHGIAAFYKPDTA